MTTKKVRELLIDASNMSGVDRENIYSVVDGNKSSTGKYKMIGRIFYVRGSYISHVDDSDSEWSDFLVVCRGVEDPPMLHDATPEQLANTKKWAIKAVDFDETPRSFPIQFFATSFNIKTPLSTNEHGG